MPKRSFDLVLAALLVLFACTEAGAGSISGRARYEDRPVTNTGFGASVFLPCRFNKIEIVRSDSTVLGTGSTDQTGNYSVTIPDGGTQTLFLRVYAQTPPTGNFDLVVFNNNTQQAIQTARTTNQSINTNLASTLDIDITVASTAAGAFNIFDQGVKAQDLLRQLSGEAPPRLTFFWQPGSTDGTFYQPSTNSIHLIGGSSDPDEFDDDVIIHETGHYMQANFSRDDSPAGAHSQADSHQDLRLAWSEGSAYWWSGIIQNKAEQRDFTAGGVSFFEMETPTNSANTQGADTETSVESILWDLTDLPSTPDSSPGVDDDAVQLSDGILRCMTVFFQEFGTGRDTTLENFYQGWFRRHGATFQKTGFDAILTRRSIDFNRPNLFENASQLTIPDAGSQVESTISVPLSIQLTAVRIFTGVTHNRPTDLVIRIVHPDGTAVTLHNRTNTPPQRDLFNWYEPFDSSVATGNTLDSFNGKNGSGTWRLQLQDFTSGTQGRLDKWRISLLGTPNSPDLAVASVSGPASATPGASIAVSSRVENRGVANTASNFTCAYLLSSSSSVPPTSPVLATFGVNGLNAGAGVNDSRNVTIPANTALGTYFIALVVDQNNTVGESNENNNTSASPSPIQINSANTPPDLVVATVSAPASSFPGGSIAVTSRIENRGNTGTSASFSNRYLLSADTDITVNDTSLATFSLNALAPGEGVNDSRTITIPAAVPQGSYFLGALADDTNAVVEASETNNGLAATGGITVGPPPSPADLQALRVLGPRTASLGSTVNVTVTVQNGGGNPVAGVFSNAIFLSDDAAITQSDLRLSTFSVDGLAAGARIDRTVPSVVPASVAAGTYFFGAVLDIDNAVAEGREDNNSAADQGGVALSPPPTQPDLVLLSVESPATGSTGRLLPVTANLANNGGTDITATFSLRFIVSRTRSPLVAAAPPADVSIAGLASGQSRRVSASITLPSTLAVGQYFVGAIADPAGAVAEASEDNNSLAPSTPVDVGIPVLAQLQVTAIDVPSTGFLGGRVVARPTLRNSGNGSSGPFSGEFLLSGRRTDLATAVSLGLFPFASLGAGQSRQDQVTLSIPSALAQGNYHVALRADPANEVEESVESDNTLVTTATVQLTTPVLPDLTVLTVEAPARIEAGVAMNLRRTIRNQGTAAMSQQWNETFVLSASSTISATAQRIATFGNQPLPLSATSDQSRLVAVPASVRPGTFFIGVVADPDNTVPEVEEGNNALAALAPTQVTASQKPDLVLELVSVPAQLFTTRSFQLTRRVRNASELGSAQGFAEVVYLSADSRITTDDTPIASFIGPALAPGATDTTTRTITLPQNTPGGTFFVGIILDPAGTVSEANETNNAAASPTASTVQANGILPDLVPADLSGPTAASAGTTITLQRRIENRGRGSLIGTFEELYVLSADSTITLTDPVLARLTGPTLVAGAVSVEARSVTLPATTPQGTYFLGLIVDPANAISEGDTLGSTTAAEANNVRAGNAISVGLPTGGKPDLAPVLVTSALEIQRGTTAGVTATIENKGTAAAESFEVRFYLSINRQVDGGGADVVLGTLSSAPLGAGGRTTLQGFFTVPANQPVGNYFILVQADPAGRIAQLDRTNDVLASSLVSISSTLTRADLFASALSFSPGRLDSGGTLALSWSIRNVGGAPAPQHKVQFFASADTNIGSPDPQIASLDLPALPASQTRSDVTTAALPAAVVTGTYFVGMLVDPDERVTEADERNNVLIATGNLAVGSAPVSGPDLRATTPTAPASAVIGTLLPVVMRIANRGSSPAIGTIVNRLYLSANATIDASDALLVEFNLSSLPQTSIATVSRAVVIPRVAPGSYTLILQTDATNVIADPSTVDDVATAPLLLRGAPDLRIELLTAPAAVQTGVAFPVRVQLANRGNVAAFGPILTRILLSFDDRPDSSDLVLKPLVFGGTLSPGTQITQDTTAAVSEFVSPGSYRVIAVTDASNSILEEDETNNVQLLASAVTVGGAPDLRALGVFGPASHAAGSGQELVITASIQNAGAAPSPAFDVGFFLSRNQTPTSTDAFVGSASSGALVPGQATEIVGRFQIPGNFPPGDYFAQVRADIGGMVTESDESPASNTIVSNSVTRIVATSAERPRVARLLVSRPDPTAVARGPLQLTAEYDRALVSAPQISVDQPGTNDLPPAAMTGSDRTWSFVYTVPADNGAFNRDGTNSVRISGGRDSLGIQAETFTSAAAFVTDTLAPVVRVTSPDEAAVVGSVVQVSGSLVEASGRASLTVGVDGGSSATPVVAGGRFDAIVTLTGDRPTVIVRASDAAGNVSPEARVSLRLDSDADGMPDEFERRFGLQPGNASDASGDPDEDGLTNLQEFRAGTNPTLGDTDGDGAGDGVEVAQGADPLNAGNRAPTARSREGAASALTRSPRVVALDGSASTDPDGDVLRYAWTQAEGPSVEILDADTALPSAVLREAAAYRFQLRVSDGKVQSSPSDVSVVVDNVTPTANAGVEQTVVPGTRVVLDGTASFDPNGNLRDYEWTESVINPELGLLVGPARPGPELTPTRPGKYDFQLRVRDTAGLTSSASRVTVRVMDPALRVIAPRADAGIDDTVNVNTRVTLDGHESVDPDAPGLPLTYTWRQLSGPPGVAFVSLSNPAAMNPSFDVVAPGVYVFQLTVRDGTDDGLDSAPDTVVVRVNSSTATIPLADAGPDRAIALGQTALLDGSRSAVRSGASLVYRWTQSSGPPAAIDLADQPIATVTPLVAGTYAFDLQVTAGTIASERARVRVQVAGASDGQPPVARVRLASPGTTAAGENRVRIPVSGGLTVELDGSESFDPEGAVLRYKWRQVLGPSIVLSSESIARPVFQPLVTRVYGFELTVSDGRLESAASIEIIVDGPSNSVPRAVVTSQATGRAGSSVTLDGTRSADPDGTTLLYRWEQIGGLPVAPANSRSARLSFVPPAPGTYRFRLFVDDGRDRSTGKEVTVTVAEAGSGGGTNNGGGSTGGSTTGGGGGGASCAMAGEASATPLVYVLLMGWLLRRRSGAPGAASR